MMRSSSFKAGSGRIVVALLGLFFLKALGDGYGGGNTPRGRAAEGMQTDQHPLPNPSTEPTAVDPLIQPVDQPSPTCDLLD